MIENLKLDNYNSLVDYLKSVPFNVNRTSLYNAKDLYGGYDVEQPETFENCYDTRIYRHYISKGKQTNDVKESLARTLHDHAIYVALGEFFRTHNYLHCVGMMGGHALMRTDKMYRQIVFLSKQLTELGYYMLSGGGPGAMEATHLGAWMAGYTNGEVEDVLRILSKAPSYRDSDWLSSAFEVVYKYPQEKFVSLAIPTWLYGQEPSTPLATHIAKFFENSIRENNILTLPFGGIIYTPGSAGTVQEVFQDAVQNHYLSYGFPSPMIFLDTKFWTEEIPLYPLLQKLSDKGKYKNLSMCLTDNSDEILEKLNDFQKQAKSHPEDYCLH